MAGEMEVATERVADLKSVDMLVSTSLDLAKPEGRKLLMAAMQDCDARLTEQVNVPMVIRDYVMHVVEIVNKDDGEVTRCNRLVLIDMDGLTYACVAETLVRSIQVVAYAYGAPPWPDGLKLVVRTKKRGERSIYWFDVTQ